LASAQQNRQAVETEGGVHAFLLQSVRRCWLPHGGGFDPGGRHPTALCGRHRHPGLLADLTTQVETHSGLPLLRIHWYDAGTRAGTPGGNQREIATIPKVKLRLGRIGFNGEQKGVDLKLALDLISQSRNRSSEIVYLISGDDDLSEAVEEA